MDKPPRTAAARQPSKATSRPAPLSSAVSAQMSRMPRASSKPEIRLRRELHSRGMRFRLHDRRLPGTPDVVFSRARIAVFVDGCFWHMCPDHGSIPKNNREWWAAKLGRNVERDREKDSQLSDMGWQAIHVWEHEDVAAAADRIEQAWQERVARLQVPAAGIAAAYPGEHGRRHSRKEHP